MARGRFAPVPLHRYSEAVDVAIAQIQRTGFWLWDDLDYYSGVVAGREFLTLRGTVSCAGGVRVQVEERLRLHRPRRWAPKGPERLMVLIGYSNCAVLHGRGNIFRYDSPDPESNENTPDHHRYHHRHRFDTLGTGTEIWPPDRVPEDEVPTLRQVLQEAESWYWANLGGRVSE